MNKIKAVGRMARMFGVLREESETLLKIKSMAPDGKIPRGLLLEGRPAIKDAMGEYDRAR
jgi:serine/threonine-protein phosphatase 2B catalytic subunit